MVHEKKEKKNTIRCTKKKQKKKNILKPNDMVHERMQKRARFGARRNAEKKWCTNILKKNVMGAAWENAKKKSGAKIVL